MKKCPPKRTRTTDLNYSQTLYQLELKGMDVCKTRSTRIYHHTDVGSKRFSVAFLTNQKAHLYEGRSESSNNSLIIQLIFIVKQNETYLI